MKKTYLIIFSGLTAVIVLAIIRLTAINPSNTSTQLYYQNSSSVLAATSQSASSKQVQRREAQASMALNNEHRTVSPDTFSFNEFDQAFKALLGQHQGAPYDLFRQLYDPEAYLESLRELAVYQPPDTVGVTDPALHTKPSASLRIGTHIDPNTGELREVHNVNELPASLTVMLDIPDNEYVQYMLVRWIDTDNNSVIGMEMVASSGIGGSQIFTSQPIPRYEGSHYLIEVFDAGENIELIAAGSIAIERLGRSIILPN